MLVFAETNNFQEFSPGPETSHEGAVKMRRENTGTGQNGGNEKNKTKTFYKCESEACQCRKLPGSQPWSELWFCKILLLL